MKSPILRPYQEESLTEIHRFFNESGKRALMNVMPTGTGKTTVFSKLTLSLERNFYKVLIIVHRIELVDQIVSRLKEFGVKPGIIGGDYAQNLYLNVQVGMVQSLSPELSFVPDYVIIDECHHSTATTYNRLWSMFPNAKVLGVTATPIRLDGKGFDDLYDEMLELYPITWYFDKGYLVRPRHYFCSYAPNIEKIVAGDYDLVEQAKEMHRDNRIAEVLNAYRHYAANRRAVVFAVNIEHSKKLAASFNANGIPAAHIDGELDKVTRRNIIKDYTENRIQVIVNYDIVSEGFDVPAIEAVILTRKSKSLSYFLQAVGRCLRISEGKKQGYVLDCAGMWLEHGFAGMNIKWCLEGNQKEVIKSICKSRLFYEKGEELKTIYDNPEELKGVDLINLDSKLERLVMFDKKLKDLEEKSKLSLTNQDYWTTVEDYFDLMRYQGVQVANDDINYCKRKLELRGILFPDHYYQNVLQLN